MSEINVAVADDNERILDLLGEMIDEDKDLNLVGKANNGEDAYTLIKEKQPDVVLHNIRMFYIRTWGCFYCKNVLLSTIRKYGND